MPSGSEVGNVAKLDPRTGRSRTHVRGAGARIADTSIAVGGRRLVRRQSSTRLWRIHPRRVGRGLRPVGASPAPSPSTRTGPCGSRAVCLACAPGPLTTSRGSRWVQPHSASREFRPDLDQRAAAGWRAIPFSSRWSRIGECVGARALVVGLRPGVPARRRLRRTARGSGAAARSG
jgi:hypothetical protein